MIIKSLKMKNYRPYRNPNPIHFAYGNSNLTIIEGDNDLGKTILLNAISWCLYEDEPYRKYSRKEYNKDARDELKNGEELEVTVEITMEDNEGNDIIFHRSRRYRRANKRINKVPNDEEFIIYKSNPITGNEERILDTNKYIETHLPHSLKEYFLFDGERLLEWFSGDTNAVKKAIERLSQYDLIEIDQEH